ncbi:MAG: Alpha-L-fucosidase [Herbinix sp.]|nr:Alpha-L-fucosidase [Herbinix sp.]
MLQIKKKSLRFGFAIAIFCIVLLSVFQLAGGATVAEAEASSKANVYKVKKDGTGDFTSIQAAANIVRPGDTIEIFGGTYREEVVLPRGGTDEQNRVTIKAAEGEKVIITGSEVVSASEWKKTTDEGVYVITKEKDYFGSFNPFNEWWMSKGSKYSNYFSCGSVYMKDIIFQQVWSMEELKKTDYSWYAEVESSTGRTTIYANFAKADPTDAVNVTEINKRKQCITAAWNQGYITIDGITAMHGCGPKTIDFWQTKAKPMAGAISTNGGFYWIIQNCEVTESRGVAIDYGNGSRMQEDLNGGEPEIYGHHIIRYCKVYNNGTNGMMAYRGAYTEIYGCTLSNNNTLNTGLLSEAYIKDVSGGWGIYIHDNYFYSDQTWAVYPIWLDSECDGTRVSNNVFYCKGDGQGFTYIDYEVNAGYSLCDNNVFVGVGWHIMSASNTYFVNNLFLNTPEDSAKRSWPGLGKWGFIGSEGWDGYQRAMRIVKPGTLDIISTVGNSTSRFETYNRYNKMLNNIFFENGPSGTTNESEVSEKDYNGSYTEVVLSKEAGVNPDYSGGSWSHPEVGKLPIAWKEAYQKTVGSGTLMYGNECDYNVYYGGAKKIDHQYAQARGYLADANSVESSGGSYTVDATEDSFKLTLTVDDSCTSINAPAITGEYLGNTGIYEFLGQEFYAPDVDADILGNSRSGEDTIVGPFADLKTGKNSYTLWPRTISDNSQGSIDIEISISNTKESPSVTVVDNKITVSPARGINETSASATENKADSTEDLPKTGDHSTGFLSALGVIVSLILLSVLYHNKRNINTGK